MSFHVTKANKVNLLASYIRQVFNPKIRELSDKAVDELKTYLLDSDDNLAEHFKSLVGGDYKVLRPVEFAELNMKGLNIANRYDVKNNELKNPVITFPTKVCVHFTGYEMITIKGERRLKVDYIPSEMPSLGAVVTLMKRAQDQMNCMESEIKEIHSLRELSDYFDSKMGEAA